MLAAIQAGHQRQGDSDPNIKESAFGRNFRRRISEAHTPAYKTITLPGFPNTKHGPEWNPCASPEGEGLSADCAKQSAHMMKQVKKLRTRVSLIKRSLLCSSGSQRRNSSSLLSHARCFAQNDAGMGRYQRSQTALPTFR